MRRLGPLRGRDFRLLFIGQTTSRLGAAVLTVGATLLVLASRDVRTLERRTLVAQDVAA